MAKVKHLDAEIWCPRCKHMMGRIFRVEVRDGFFEHVTEPKGVGKYCNVCEGVLERKK